MAGGKYPVVIHQDKRETKDAASVTTRSSAKSRTSSVVSNDSYTIDNTSMWSHKEATLIDSSKTRFHSRTGQIVTVWNEQR